MALPMLLSACGTDAFYVEHATLSHLKEHHTLRTTAIQGTRSTERIEDFMLTGHRITADGALVLAYRTSSGRAISLVDQAHFEKLTILLPANFSKVVGSETVFQDDSEAMAYWSKGSANFPGKSGCYGYGSSGSLTITGISTNSITAAIDLTIQSVSPAGWKSECEKLLFRKTLVFEKRLVQDLTPWDGTMGAHIYDESIKK